jgi:tetratricopeptide (TPR) repeat protein
MFREAFKLDPKFVDPYAYLTALYVDVCYYHIGSESDSYCLKAKGLLDTLVALNIDKAFVHVALGSYRYKIDHDYDAALAEFSKAIEQDPANMEAPLLRSEIHKTKGKLDEAIQDLKNVLDRSPNEEFHLFSMFETYLFMRNAGEALKYIDKLIALVPEKSLNYETKAHCLVALRGDLKGARNMLKTAQPLFGDKFDLLFKYIDVLEGNYSAYMDYLLQHPDTIQENENTVRTYSTEIGILYSAQGKSAEAKKYFARALNLLETRKQNNGENDFPLLNALGVAYAGMGDRQKALEYGNRARELAPLSADLFIGMIALENMAVIHTLLGEQDEAINILHQLMQLPFSWNTSNTIPLLKMSPQWNSLRSNPKFKKLVGT